MTYYTVYKTTNQINGKFYIGCHKTKDLNDSYMGSGKLIKRAIEKYGLENFKKEVLHVYDNPDDMFAKEAEIVTDDFLMEENTYNLKVGGEGGFDHINKHPEQYLTEKRLSSLCSPEETWKIIKQRCLFDSDYAQALSRQQKEKSRRGIQKQKELYPKGTFHGKSHSDATKRLMSESAKKRLIDPRNNSQYGTMWITNGSISKKVNKTEQIPNGWIKGRVMKKK